MQSLGADINSKLTERLKSTTTNHSVENNWNYLKDTIHSAAETHILQKTLNGKQHVPWINQSIKRMIKQRQRRYNAAKRHDTPENWKKKCREEKNDGSIR
jgi:hypothetical protein